MVNIAEFRVEQGMPCFIIAEAGVNHNGSLDMARQLIDTAVAAGADAVKFQTFQAERLVTEQARKAAYQQQTTDAEESQFEMLKRLELLPEMHQELIDYCRQNNILFLSTPFDELSADFLNELMLPAFKIPSGELTNLPFLAHVARFGKPLLISTGMAYLGEVETALRTVQQAGNDQIVLLHCVSNYPADPADVNLKAMGTMRQAFAVPVGYSDHTLGVDIPLAAVAMGACVIEKHFTLDRTLPGPDHRVSLEPQEFKAMVDGIRRIEAALGNGRKIPAASETDTAAVARKSVVAACALPANTRLTPDMLAIKRPGDGFAPAMLPSLVGRTTAVAIPAGTVIRPEMLR